MALQGGAPFTISGQGAVPVWNPGQPAPPGYHVSADGQSLISDTTGQTVISRPAVNGNITNANNPAPGITVGNFTLPTSVTNAITKDNPVAGTINAGVDLANGNGAQASSDFGAGTSGGTLPQIDSNGNITAGNMTSGVASAAGVPSGVPGVTGPVTGAGGVTNDLAGLGNLISGLGGNLLGPSLTGLNKASADAQALEQQFLGQLKGMQPIPAPQMTAAQSAAAQLEDSRQAQFRQQQADLANSLSGVIAGNAPSVAQLQQQQAFGQQMAQQQGLAAALGRGGNQALAMRTAMNNIGQLGAQQAAASALLRAQEQTAARGQLGDVLNAARGTDVTVAGQNAAQQQQTALANAANQQAASANNQNAGVATNQQNINQQQVIGNQTLQANQNDVAAQVGAIQAQTAKTQATGNLLATGAGVLATLSDERAKKNIATISDDDMRAFYQAISPQSWKYKGSNQPRVGPMAQDVERSKVGRTMVRETPAGKAIDIPSATSAMLAAIADLGKRLERVEGARR